MYIFESEGLVNQEAMRQKRFALKSALPDLNFGKDDYMIFDHITGYAGYETERNIHVQAFPHCNIAVVSDKEDLDTSDKIRALGYRVPEKRLHIAERPVYRLLESTEDYYVRVGEPDRAVTPNEILWEELKAGFGYDAIRKNLATLLSPVISLPCVSEYEFAIYQHHHATSDDTTGYNKYSDVFRLPPEIVVDALLLKLRFTYPHDVMAISSRVMTKNGEGHIPMVDFMEDCDPEEMLARIHAPRNVLVYSGNSHHHYDTGKLLTQGEFESYMKLLSEQPEVGTTWPELQIEQGFSLLRITPCASKPFYPELVE